ncbi:Uncharacterised protein [uncultured Eubacterium sp.]|nr:Uncharacterised protein [uncultured Eubacterium sp.]
MRAAKAAAITYFLSNEGKSAAKTQYYDIKEGTMTSTQPEGYNKAKQKDKNGKPLEEGAAVVQVTYVDSVDTNGKDTEGNVTAAWVSGAAKAGS